VCVCFFFCYCTPVLDVDGDGELNFTELMTLFSTLYKGAPEERLKFLFQAYDMDNSGYLDREELHMLMSKIRKALSNASAPNASDFSLWDRAFDSLDVNHDNRLSFE
jgi:Ca2+-binding EF-hand superfamily protein